MFSQTVFSIISSISNHDHQKTTLAWTRDNVNFEFKKKEMEKSARMLLKKKLPENQVFLGGLNQKYSCKLHSQI